MTFDQDKMIAIENWTKDHCKILARPWWDSGMSTARSWKDHCKVDHYKILVISRLWQDPCQDHVVRTWSIGRSCLRLMTWKNNVEVIARSWQDHGKIMIMARSVFKIMTFSCKNWRSWQDPGKTMMRSWQAMARSCNISSCKTVCSFSNYDLGLIDRCLAYEMLFCGLRDC